MASCQHNQLHFVLFPFMAQGHITPMIDIARLLAQRGVMITIVTTPANALRFKPILDRAKESGLSIKLITIPFPSVAGLPRGCECLDLLPSLSLSPGFFDAANMLLEPVDRIWQGLVPKPNCIISDRALPYTTHIAERYSIPRISFTGTCCFISVFLINQSSFMSTESVTSENEYFVAPGLPDRIEITKAQLPSSSTVLSTELIEKIGAAEEKNYGVIFNSFHELEPAYVERFKSDSGAKVWCVGPVSLCNKGNLDKVQRGNKASIDEHECSKWLNSWTQASVLYVCLGSICNVLPKHMIELALGIEESKVPFIWAMREGDTSNKFESWVSQNGFEERTKGRGLLIRGWAPQILILSHPSIGGFLTHCGWNSLLEAVCAGTPMITLPLFADQFLNEKLVVQVLRIGVAIGVHVPLKWGEEEKVGMILRKEDVKKAISLLMSEEGKEIRKRAREIGDMSKKAMEEGGSSYLNMTLLIEEIRQHAFSTQIVFAKDD